MSEIQSQASTVLEKALDAVEHEGYSVGDAVDAACRVVSNGDSNLATALGHIATGWLVTAGFDIQREGREPGAVEVLTRAKAALDQSINRDRYAEKVGVSRETVDQVFGHVREAIDTDAALTKALGIGPGETLVVELPDDREFDELLKRAEPEEAKERRLAREAQTVRLATYNEVGATDSVRVEITYQFEGQPEHCGFFIAHVRCVEGEHPVDRATALVQAWSDDKSLAYFAIDEATSA